MALTLFVCSLKYERELLEASLADLDATSFPLPPHTKLTLYGGGRTGLIHCGLGAVRFSRRLAEYLPLLPTPPSHIIGVGTAGALTRARQRGDIISARRIIDTVSGDIYTPAPLPLARIPTVRQGTILAVKDPVNDTAAARRIAADTGADAVCLEAAGGYRAANAAGIPYSEVRVISDHGDLASRQEFKNRAAAVLPRLAALIRSRVLTPPAG